MTERFPYELRLPLAPYRFEWRDEAAVDASKHATDAYSEERYTHADGTTTVIREYRSDGTFHVMSDRGTDARRGPKVRRKGGAAQASYRVTH